MITIFAAVIWLLAAGLAFAAEEVVGTNGAYAFGVVLGSSLIYVLLTVLLSKTSTLRNRRAVAWYIGGGLFLIVSARSYQKSVATKADLQGSVAYARSAGSNTNSDGVTTVDTASLTFVITEYGNNATALWQDYRATMDSVGVNYLDPAQLVSETGRLESARSVRRSKAAISILTSGLRREAGVARSRLVALERGNERLRGATAGFDSSSATALALISRFGRAEVAILGVADSIILLSQVTHPRLGSDGKSLVFQRAKDAQVYNSLLSRLQVLAPEEATAIQQLQQRSTDFTRSADQMDSVLRQH